MKIPTTLDRKTWKKWLICPALAVLLALTVLPVYASESQAEPTEEIIAEEDAGSESAQESAASGEQQETDWEEQSSKQQDTVPEDLSSEQQETVSEESVVDPQEEISENLVIEQQMDAADPAAVATVELTDDLPYVGEVLNGGYVGFKNKASGKYLTISGGSITAGTNVFQSSQNSISNSQEFYLSYSHDHKKNFSYFTIYPVNTSGNAASTRVKSNNINASTGTANVGLSYFMPTETTDRWQIEHYEGNYFIIHISSRPYESGARYVLAAQAGEGSATGTGVYDAGNVYVTTYNGANAPSASMLWEICADGDPMNIYANDITQSTGEVIVGIGDSIEYYYVPKAFNNSIDWVVNGSADLTAPGTAATNDFGTAQVSVKVNSIVEESAYLRMMPTTGDIYYIENIASGLYMKAEGTATSEDIGVIQDDYDSSVYERWQIVCVGSKPGYVRLRLPYYDKYLAASSDTSYTVSITSDLSDYTLWKIDTTADGYRVIFNKMYEEEEMTLAVPYDNSNGTALRIIPYRNNDDYQDEWGMYKKQYSAMLINYYDMGYSAYYSESSTTSIENIEDYSRAVSERFLQIFGLELSVLRTEYYNSPIDRCKESVNSSNIDTECAHALDQIHHTNRNNVINNFLLLKDGNIYKTAALWSAHRIKSENAAGIDEYNRSCSCNYSIFMLNRNEGVARESRSIGILLHEMCHQYGARDHYHDQDENGDCVNGDICSECKLNGRSPMCIMASIDRDITAPTVICEDCKGEILEHLDDHHDY